MQSVRALKNKRVAYRPQNLPGVSDASSQRSREAPRQRPNFHSVRHVSPPHPSPDYLVMLKPANSHSSTCKPSCSLKVAKPRSKVFRSSTHSYGKSRRPATQSKPWPKMQHRSKKKRCRFSVSSQSTRIRKLWWSSANWCESTWSSKNTGMQTRLASVSRAIIPRTRIFCPGVAACALRSADTSKRWLTSTTCR